MGGGLESRCIVLVYGVDGNLSLVFGFWSRMQNCEKGLSASSFPTAWNTSAPIARIFMKFGI